MRSIRRTPLHASNRLVLLAILSGGASLAWSSAAQAQAKLDEIAVEGSGGPAAAPSSGNGAGREGAGGERADGPVSGFVATRSATGTKTDTPLIRTPQSIAVVTADQIRTQQATSLGETLNYVAGVAGQVNGAGDTRCGGQQIRGFDVTSNSVYRDGLRLPGTSQADFNCLDPYGAERIEVLKGPASVLYGQNGPGGIINYVSKKPLFTPFGEVALAGGDFDRVQGSFDFGGPVEQTGGELAYRMTGVVRQAGNQVDFVKDDRVFLAPSLTWRPDADTTLTILSNYQKDRAGWGLQFLPALGTVFANAGRYIPRNRFVGIPGQDRYDTEQASIGYQFEHRFSDDLIVRQNLRYSHMLNDQFLAYGGGYADAATGELNRFGGAGRSVLGTFAVDNTAQVRFETGPLFHTMLFGLDYRHTTYTDSLSSFDVSTINVFNPVYSGVAGPVSVYQDNKVRQDQVGLYLQDEIRLDRFTLVLAGRSDWADTTIEDRLNGGSTARSDQAFTGKAGLIYNFDNGIAPYVSYSQSFLPTLQTLNGAVLAPETGEQYEVGVKYQPPGLNAYFTAAAFDLTRQNVIRFDAVNATFQPRQTGEIASRGVELEAVVSLAEGLNVRAAYAYIDAEITKDPDGGNQGKVPTTVPRNRASAFADYTIQTGDWRGLGFGGGVRFVGSTFGDDANTFKVPQATVFDSVISYTRDNYRFSINATNLLDKRYVASCFNAEFGCFYAEGRRVVARLSYRW